MSTLFEMFPIEFWGVKLAWCQAYTHSFMCGLTLLFTGLAMRRR